MTTTYPQLLINTLADMAQDETLPPGAPQLFQLAAAKLSELQHELAMIRLLARGAGRGRDRATLDSITFSVTQAIGPDDPASMGGWGDYKATFHRAQDDGQFLPALTLGYHIEKVVLADLAMRQVKLGPLTVEQRMSAMMGVTESQMKRARKALANAEARIAYDKAKVHA